MMRTIALALSLVGVAMGLLLLPGAGSPGPLAAAEPPSVQAPAQSPAQAPAQPPAQAPAKAPAQPPRVKLAVLLVFDQLRGDFLERWKPLLGKEGFVRLQTEGAHFVNCHYPYGTTTTGPGHASMLTGTCPDRHGIINNGWYEKGESVYCAGSKRYSLVPAPAGKATTREGGTPERLRAETVADVLKATYPQAKVIGLSLKDRSAILPTGQRPDGAYWFTTQFVTSTFYTDRLPAWVEEFNTARIADRWFNVEWTRLRPDVDYDKWSGPDDMPGEGKGVQVTALNDPARGWAQGRTFPHGNTGGRSKPGKEYYEALANSPFGNELLWEFTKACVVAEKLGADDVPDLLVVSFSSNDLVGHTWGPDSHEVLDITLRSDVLMAELLAFLDAKVGKGQYLVGVTADHGVCPLVEVSRKQGREARRVDPRTLQSLMQDQLTQRFAPPVNPAVAALAGGVTLETAKRPTWVQSVSLPWFYLNAKAAAAAGVTEAELAQAAATILATHEDVARVFTRADLAGSFPKTDRIAQRVQRSFDPQRSGDVYVVLKEWYLPSRPLDTGTTHGAPYDYDTHVPLLVFGPGIPGGRREEATTPQALAAIFAKWLGVRNPDKAEFPIPASLEKK